MVGDPPDCVGCTKCHSTLANTADKCKQRIKHTFVNIGEEQTCEVCFHVEIDDTPQQEYAMIFLNSDNEWINSFGEVMNDILVEKYDINGRFLRDGTFDERDDMKSMLINKNR